MGFRLALAQCTYPEDNDIVAMARTWFAAASEQNADLLVFPEAFMGPYDEQSKRYINDPEPLQGPFAMEIDSLAAEYGIWTVYTITEANAAGNSPFNTALVTDSDGRKQGVYRKIHLFDAQGYRESDRLAAGDSLFVPLEMPFCTLGLAICYDLRFPEVARKAALNGCQVMLFPSAWVSGHGKTRQWETLLAARAIENGMFTAARIGATSETAAFSLLTVRLSPMVRQRLGRTRRKMRSTLELPLLPTVMQLMKPLRSYSQISIYRLSIPCVKARPRSSTGAQIAIARSSSDKYPAFRRSPMSSLTCGAHP